MVSAVSAFTGNPVNPTPGVPVAAAHATSSSSDSEDSFDWNYKHCKANEPAPFVLKEHKDDSGDDSDIAFSDP